MAGDRPRNSYTVKQLADLSGVSVRTLHHYDEIGLLKPASVGANGYRQYGREELLRLQQILFQRELELSLDQIRQALDAPGFDRAKALRQHREKLLHEAERFRQLVRTIDETLAELEGGTAMNEKAMYGGFDPESRARYEAWAIERYGESARFGIETRDKIMAGWTEADRDHHLAEARSIFGDFAAALAENLAVDSERVQATAEALHAHVSKAWTRPLGRGGMLNIAVAYAENPEIRATMDRRAPGLAVYVSKALRVFAVADPWPGD